MKSLRLLFSGLFLALLISAPVVAFASNITSALYGGTIVISNNSTAASNVATVMTLSTADLISQGYTDATLSNVAIQSNGSDVPFMPSYGANPWVIWATSVAANSQNANTLFTGGTSMSSTKYFFPGSAGMTVPDNASLEMGNIGFSSIVIRGYFDMTAGADKYIINKPGALQVYVSPSNSGNITCFVNGSFYQSASGITSGYHTLTIERSGSKVDDVYLSPSSIIDPFLDNSANWTFASGSSMVYVESIQVIIPGGAGGLWSWQYATTFTDQSGNGNTATPSFRTTSSSANVTANMTAFAPISTANAPAFAVASPSSFYPSTTTTSGSFTTGNVSGAGFPGSGLVDAGAAAAGIPNIWLWGILGGFTMVMGGLLISIMVRFGGAGNGELFLRMGLGVTVIGIMVALGKYDMWMIIFYLFIAGAFAMASRQYDIGASVSEFNFIGFLSQSWVGLVGINRILEGSFMTSSDSSQWNTLMFTQQYTIGDTFTLPIMNFSFWTEGLPNMVKWNYTFFGGNAQMIQYLLYSLTAILAFIIFGLIIGTLSRTFTR